MGEPTVKGKSINMLRSQADRLRLQTRYAIEGAILNDDDAEVERLWKRHEKITRIQDRYEGKILNQPDQKEANRKQGALALEVFANPEKRDENARLFAEIHRKRGNRIYPRSIYATNNRK